MSGLTKIDKLNKILHYVEHNDISAYKIANATKISEAGIGKILNKSSKNPQERTIDAIYDYLFGKKKEYDQPDIENHLNEDSINTENQNELKAHFEKLLKKVNKTIGKLEKEDVVEIDALEELKGFILLKKEIQKELDSL